MSERITISAPDGTKARLVEKARARGMTVSKMLAMNEYYVMPENIADKVLDVAESYGVTPSDILVAGVFMYLKEHHSNTKGEQ